MGTRRKWTAGAVAVVCASLGLCACSSSGSAKSGGATTITFWNSFTSSDRPAVEALVRKFNSSQTAAKVKMTIEPADVLNQKLLPAYAAGKGPTITTLDASQVPEFASKGVLADVNDVYGGGGLNPSTLPKASLDSTTWRGKQYGVPFAATGTMLYYNKKLFARAGITQPPTTMDELVTDAKKTTNYTGKQSSSQYGFIIPDHAAPATWAALIEAQGGSIVSGDNKTSMLGDPKTVQAMSFWNDLIRNDHISPVGLSGVDTDNLFSAGRAAMYINGPWASSGFTQAKIDFGVVAVPAGSATQTCTAISVNMHLNARASQAQKKAATAFFKFWNTPTSQTYWATHSAYPPNLSTIPASALSANPISAEFQGAKGAKFYLGGLTTASQIDTNAVIPAIQKITNGGGSPQSVLSSASKQVQQLLDQAQ